MQAHTIPLTSVLLRVPTTARNLILPNDEAKLQAGGYLFADGVRNAFDLAFRRTAETGARANRRFDARKAQQRAACAVAPDHLPEVARQDHDAVTCGKMATHLVDGGDVDE